MTVAIMIMNGIVFIDTVTIGIIASGTNVENVYVKTRKAIT